MTTNLCHDSPGNGKQWTDRQDNKSQLPTIYEADDEAGNKGWEILEQQRQFVSDAFLNLVNVTEESQTEI